MVAARRYLVWALGCCIVSHDCVYGSRPSLLRLREGSFSSTGRCGSNLSGWGRTVSPQLHGSRSQSQPASDLSSFVRPASSISSRSLRRPLSYSSRSLSRRACVSLSWRMIASTACRFRYRNAAHAAVALAAITATAIVSRRSLLGFTFHFGK
jgi:hypothetical protein